MSIQAMSHYMKHGSYTNTEWSVLVALANFCDEEGMCWPAIATIARITRLEERSVQRAIKDLSDPETCELLGRAPAIRVERYAGKNRKKTRNTNRYILVEWNLIATGAYSPPSASTASVFKKPAGVILPKGDPPTRKERKQPLFDNPLADTESTAKNGAQSDAIPESTGDTVSPRSGDRVSPQEIATGDRTPPHTGDTVSPKPLEVWGDTVSPDPLTITIKKDEPPINNEEEEDDSVIHLWNALEKIVDRPLTRSEYILLEQACGDEIGQDCALFAIEGLRAAWLKPDFRMRHDTTSYLQRVIANERKNREIQSKQRREKYMPTRPDAFEVEERPAPISAYEAALKNEPVSTQPVALSPHEELWKKTLGELQLQLATGTFTSWLQNTKAVPGEGDTITVAAANLYARDWLDNRLKGIVRRTLKIITGNSNIDVAFVLREPNLPNASMA